MWSKHAGSISWVGYTKLIWREVTDRPNWKDRPPDLLGSDFLINLVNGKLHVIGNIGANNDLSFNHDIFELIEGYDDSLFEQLRSQMLKTLRSLKDKGILHQGGISQCDPMNEFLVFCNASKPTRVIIDFFYRDNSTLMRKWSNLAIEDILPISTTLIAAAMKKITAVPFRGSQYRLELITCSVRTERHISLIRGEDRRVCEICGKIDSLVHFLLFCTHAQVAWCVLSKTVKSMFGVTFKINASTVFLGTLAGITNDKQKCSISKWLNATIHFLCRNYYLRTALLSSRQIANELKRQYSTLSDFKICLADPKINTFELNFLITNLGENELRAGEGNLIIHLRNRLGRFVPPQLELEGGFISTAPYRHPCKGKIITTEKLMTILINKT